MADTLDYEARGKEFRAWCQKRGIDCESLIEGAAKHFTSGRIEPRTGPLTEEGIEAYAKSEMRFRNNE